MERTPELRSVLRGWRVENVVGAGLNSFLFLLLCSKVTATLFFATECSYERVVLCIFPFLGGERKG